MAITKSTTKPRPPRKTIPVAEVAAELGAFEENSQSAPTPTGADFLRIEYVPIDTVSLWEANAKIHDEGAIWKSLQLHGFKDPPKWEPKLNGGAGGVVEGNGRSHVLREMRDANEPPPRGILVDKTSGHWLMPLVFGVDAESEIAAEAYGIDHNNVGMLGGDFKGIDIAKLYEPKGYADIIAKLSNQQAMPVSVTSSDLDALISKIAKQSQNAALAANGIGAPSNSLGLTAFEQTQHIEKSGDTQRQFSVVVICEDEGEQKAVFDTLKEKYDDVKIITS